MIKQKTIQEPEPGYIYESSTTGDMYQILYVDEKIVLFRSNNAGRNGLNGHRIERRVPFDENVKEGQLEYKPESNLDMLTSSDVDWENVDYIGEKTAENLHDAGYDTTLEIQKATDDELLSVSGLGKSGLQNLREFSR